MGAGGTPGTAPASAPSAPASAPSASSLRPVGNQGTYISPRFLGQHLMSRWDLQPQIPVHAMRLWDSNTKWCQMDKGTASNQYVFGQLDALLGQASQLGADVEFTFGGTPQWAASGSYPQLSSTDQCSSSSTSMPPANESSWTNFVTALVTHAKGKIHAYELWNEVNDPYFWSGSVDQLVRMSVDAAAIIHRIDPSALVLSPSVTANSPGYAYLKQYLSSLPSGTIDAIAVHSYTNGACPEGAVPAEMNSVKASLPAAYAKTPIWSTEGSWGQNNQLTSVGCNQQAFVARYDLLMASQGFVRNYWYAYQNSGWGTLWDGTSLTPAGIATRTVDGWLAGATLTGCKSSSDGNLWTCDLTTSAGKKARVVWATKWAVSYSTSGYSTVKTLEGASLPATGSIKAVYEPVLLSS
jgi:hypothetical protein